MRVYESLDGGGPLAKNKHDIGQGN